MGRLLTVAQVTRLSGLNRKTVEKRVANGTIGSIVDAASGKAMIDVSELLRVFPDIPADAIERELGGKITGNAGKTGSAPSLASSARGGLGKGDDNASALRERVAALETEIGYLKKLIVVYEGDLQAAREREANLMMLLNRATSGLPAPSKKSSAASVQPRDAKGHFQSPKPKQAQASLLPKDGDDGRQ